MNTSVKRELLIWGVFIQYIVVFCLGICAAFASTEYLKGELRARYHFLFLIAALFLCIVGHEILIWVGERNYTKQLFVINAGLLFLFSALYVRGRESLNQEGGMVFCLSFILIIAGCLYLSVRDLLFFREQISVKNITEKINSFINTRKYLIVLLLVVLGIALYNSDAEPRWDGAYIYIFLNKIDLNSIFSIEDLQFCGHISQSYIAFNKILGVIFGNLLTGMSIGNILLFLISVCSVYGILKNILKGKSDLEYTILTAIYAISPFVLGLVNYNYWDYWVITLFPVIIYCTLTNKWIWHLGLAFILCFVKEPAVISYAFYCIGIIIIDLVCMKQEGIGSKLKCILMQKKYWGMLVIGVSWICIYISLPNWDGVGDFSLNAGYMISKLKVFLVLNFNWILALAAGMALSYLLIKKNVLFLKLLPILLSDVAFTVFSCIFVTVNHARYIDSHIVVLNIIALVGVGMIIPKVWGKIAAMCLLALMGISNYTIVDPLTLEVFPHYDVGSTIMISTSDEYLSDSMVYNQQYKYFDKALNVAMEEVMEQVMENEAVICFPGRRPWYFDGICGAFGADEETTVVEERWNPQRNKRVYIGKDESIPFNVYSLTVQSNLKEIVGGKTGYYFYIPCWGKEIMQFIEQETNIEEKKMFSYRGWEVTRVQFVLD